MTERPADGALVVRDHRWLAAATELAERSLTERSRHRKLEQLVLWGGRELVVAPRFPWHYATLAEAVTDANEGDRIVVAPGVYHESLTVSKSVVIEGFPEQIASDRVRAEIVIVGVEGPALVYVGCGGELRRVGLGGGGPLPGWNGELGTRDAALGLLGASTLVERVGVGGTFGVVVRGGRPVLRDCEVHAGSRWSAGLVLEGATQATVEDSRVAECSGNGVEIAGASTSPTIMRSDISRNGWIGVCVQYGASPRLVGNSIMGNKHEGLYLVDCQAIVEVNSITRNDVGIRLIGSGSRIDGNEFRDNKLADIIDEPSVAAGSPTSGMTGSPALRALLRALPGGWSSG